MRMPRAAVDIITSKRPDAAGQVRCRVRFHGGTACCLARGAAPSGAPQRAGVDNRLT